MSLFALPLASTCAFALLAGSGVRWLDLSRDARLVRTDAGWVSGDPLGLQLSLVWRRK